MKLGLLGGGAWGTALAKALAPNFESVTIAAMEEDVVKTINENNQNIRYLPNIQLPKNVFATQNPQEIQECEVILITTPAQYMRETLAKLKNTSVHSSILICAKGLEISTGKLLSQVVDHLLPKT
jgi:glycerol-3-phosphate dehydrogenase (NAD(P)+)